MVAGDGDAGPDLVVSRFAHLGAVQNLAALGIEYVHLATVVLQVDLAVGAESDSLRHSHPIHFHLKEEFASV